MMYTPCPQCHNYITHYNFGYDGSARFCKMCGYAAYVYRVRDNIDLDKDLGRYKFIYTDTPWGHVTLISKYNTSTETSVDIKKAEDFIRWLVKNANDYKYAYLSCIKDGENININLLDLL